MVAAFAGAAALLVGWIPVIGQALAAILGTLALVAALVSLLANLSLAATGYGSWTNVLLDVVSLASFGIGRAVVGGARAAYRGAQATARLNAGRIAASSPGVRAAAGLPTGGATSTIRSLVGNGRVAAMSRNQARSVAQSARTVPSYSWRSPFTTAWSDLCGLPANLRTLTPTNLRDAVQQVPSSLADLGRSRSCTELTARLTQNRDVLAHLDFRAGVNAAVQSSEAFTRATNLTQVQVATTSVGWGLDSY